MMTLTLSLVTLAFLMGCLYHETRGTSAQSALLICLILYVGLGVSIWWEWDIFAPHLPLIVASAILILVQLFSLELKRTLATFDIRSRWRRAQKVERESTTADIKKELMNASESLAKREQGALIVIEQRADLSEFISGGVEINAQVKASLIHAIFCHNGNDFHDGAIVIRKGLIWQAKAFLPMPHSITLSQKYGTRHLAAVGITDQTDAVVIVVSEERGVISVAYAGQLSECVDRFSLDRTLSELLLPISLKSKSN